jgi:uncharacterized membrane protein
MARERLPSIDAVRGAVMVVMALDHARDLLCSPRPSPTDLSSASAVLFLTRWVTHFCAPVFVFLAGTGAYLQGARTGRAPLARFLVGRGLILVLLEVTVEKLAVLPDPAYHFTILNVLWAIGGSMIALAGLCWLPLPAVAALGAAILLGHDALAPHAPSLSAALGPWWRILLAPGPLTPSPGHRLFVSYPILPWLGVMALGYTAGALFSRPAPLRRRVLCAVGGAALIAFLVLRATNAYGDPRPWSEQGRGPLFTVFSFLNCEKYPPSLLFLLMTLGPALVVLGVVEGRPVPRPLLVLGRVPLFFFLAHLLFLRLLATPLALARWGTSTAMSLPPGHAGNPEIPLAAAYLAWFLVLVALYPACRRFAALKERRQVSWTTSYL